MPSSRPIRRVNYTVESARVGARTDLDRLVIDVQTDGTITPVAALVQSANILIDQFALFQELQQEKRRPDKQGLSAGPVPSRIFDMPIEQLELSQRTYNCLKRSQITKVGQILQMSENELLSLRNFGQKSLVELREKLQEHGVLPEGVGSADGSRHPGRRDRQRRVADGAPAPPTQTTRTEPMRHRVAMRKLSRPTGHRLSLIRNLMTDLIRHERLQTTAPKAAELRREVEKLIGTARAGDLHARRLVAAKLYDRRWSEKLFAEIVPRYQRPTRWLHAHHEAACPGAAMARRWPRSSSFHNLEHLSNSTSSISAHAGLSRHAPTPAGPSRAAAHGRPRPGDARSGARRRSLGHPVRVDRGRTHRRRRPRRGAGRLVRDLVDDPARRPRARRCRDGCPTISGRSRPPMCAADVRCAPLGACGAGIATPSGAA